MEKYNVLQLQMCLITKSNSVVNFFMLINVHYEPISFINWPDINLFSMEKR